MAVFETSCPFETQNIRKSYKNCHADIVVRRKWSYRGAPITYPLYLGRQRGLWNSSWKYRLLETYWHEFSRMPPKKHRRIVTFQASNSSLQPSIIPGCPPTGLCLRLISGPDSCISLDIRHYIPIDLRDSKLLHVKLKLVLERLIKKFMNDKQKSPLRGPYVIGLCARQVQVEEALNFCMRT